MQSEQINELAAALAKAQGAMENAVFNKINPHFKSKYADLASMRDAIIPPLSANGLAVTQLIELRDGAMVLRTMLMHVSGQWLASEYPLPIGKPQEMGSAQTYARRYSLAALVCNSSEEDDDANAAEAAAGRQNGKAVAALLSQEQIDAIQSAIVEVGADIAKFCEYMKVEKIEQLPASQYAKAMGALAAKEQAKSEVSPVQIIDCDQGTETWFRARMGIPTASEFATVIMSGKAGGLSKTRKTYLRKLAGEIITGEVMNSYTNEAMERGKVMEEEARNHYAFVADVTPQRVGFIRNGSKGCSPDALIGNNGMLQLKTAYPHILIEHLEADVFPAEHKAQTQGALWIAEREWIDLSIYWPKMPPFIKRAQRDDPYIKKLSEAVDAFNAELIDLVDRVRHYGMAEAA